MVPVARPQMPMTVRGRGAGTAVVAIAAPLPMLLHRELGMPTWVQEAPFGLRSL